MTGAPNAEARQAGVMDATRALERLGGTASTKQLLRLTTRRRLRSAVRTGRIEQRTRGRYALPTATDARKAAAALTAVVCLRSAAAHYGWELKTQPRVPEVIVRRGRKLSVGQRTGVAVHWANLAHDQVEHGVTTPLRRSSTARGSRKAHRRDCARYNLLVLRGWRVLRFTWEQVMHDQAYVRWVLTELTRSVGRPQVTEPVSIPA